MLPQIEFLDEYPIRKLFREEEDEIIATLVDITSDVGEVVAARTLLLWTGPLAAHSGLPSSPLPHPPPSLSKSCWQAPVGFALSSLVRLSVYMSMSSWRPRVRWVRVVWRVHFWLCGAPLLAVVRVSAPSVQELHCIWWRAECEYMLLIGDVCRHAYQWLERLSRGMRGMEAVSVV